VEGRSEQPHFLHELGDLRGVERTGVDVGRAELLQRGSASAEATPVPTAYSSAELSASFSCATVEVR